MGMFDNLKVLTELPLNEELKGLNIDWKEQVFQTKDLENLLELYEIREDKKLYFLRQQREWEKDEKDFLGGHLKVVSEAWETVPYHGVVRFYADHCDREDLDTDLYTGTKELSWDEIFSTKGFDWWIEFLAIFDSGDCREIRIERVEKTPISARLARNKEWSIRNELKQKQLSHKIVSNLRKIPGYRTATRYLYRGEQSLHNCISKFLLKIS
jgi:hypothetical protein